MHDAKFVDLTGKRIGRLIVQKQLERTADYDYYWECICDCGKITKVRGKSLKQGTTKSCGCFHDESPRMRKKHNGKGTRLYIIWKSMRQRCNDPNCSNYKNYGQRGISVCDEWNDYVRFEKWALQNGYADNLSIDRIDNNAGYSPSNCRWVDRVVQANNTTRNHIVELNGCKYTLEQLSKRSGISHSTILRRINLGWSISDAVTIQPIIGRNQSNIGGKNMFIQIKYNTDGIEIEKIPQGDWIDLKAAENYCLNQGDYRVLSFGICCKIPLGYEAHIAPRSSTFKNWGIIQTNGVGIIDESYCGEDDVWGMPVYATRSTSIQKGDRIAQFRIMKKMEPVEFIEVDHMEDKSRGGFGSTGKQ